jgi:hypothetical protein
MTARKQIKCRKNVTELLIFHQFSNDEGQTSIIISVIFQHFPTDCRQSSIISVKISLTEDLATIFNAYFLQNCFNPRGKSYRSYKLLNIKFSETPFEDEARLRFI